MKKLNATGIKYENQSGVLVVDIPQDDGTTLRVIFEEGWFFMAALMKGDKVLGTRTIETEDFREQFFPSDEAGEGTT